MWGGDPSNGGMILKWTGGGIWYPFADYDHHALFHFPFICPFECGKFGKEGKDLQKFEYLENENSFLDEIKNNFHRFWRAIIWWKNNNNNNNNNKK